MLSAIHRNGVGLITDVLAASPDLRGLRALITGAGTGIGFAVAQAMADAGCHVGLHYWSHREGAESIARRARESGQDAHLYEADFADPSAAQRLAGRCAKDFGGVDILVSSAGWTLNSPLTEMTDDVIDRVHSINLRSPYILMRELVPNLIQAGGNLLIISSIHATLGAPGYSAYSATKGGLTALVPALAVELAPSGVRVNGIAPGLIEVERLTKDPTYDPHASLGAIPLSRAGQPTDVAALAKFVVSPSASWLTGVVLTLDGGTSALMPLAVPTGGLS